MKVTGKAQVGFMATLTVGLLRTAAPRQSARRATTGARVAFVSAETGKSECCDA